MKQYISALAVLFALLSTQVQAGLAAPTPALDDDDEEFYAGLNWTLGKGMIPEGVVGYRDATVDGSGDVDGGDISLSFNLQPLGLSKTKLKYFSGEDNLQGEIGVGYQFGKNQFLGVVGLQGPYINAGADYVLGTGLEPYAGINTIGDYDPSTLCPPGTSYIGGGLCQ